MSRLSYQLEIKYIFGIYFVSIYYCVYEALRKGHDELALRHSGRQLVSGDVPHDSAYPMGNHILNTPYMLVKPIIWSWKSINYVTTIEIFQKT